MVAPGIPTFTYGLRGILCLEVRLSGPAVDLHSGIFGGSVANPATVLVELLAKLHDQHGKVAGPGLFYPVKPPQSLGREPWANLPSYCQGLLKTSRATPLFGAERFRPLSSSWAI